MTDSPPFEDAQSFTEGLTAFLQQANENGFDVEGSWKCTTDDNGDHHWDVQITTVEYDNDD